MRLFVTGISGLLGLNIALQTRGDFEVNGCYYNHPVTIEGVRPVKLDVTSFAPLNQALRKIRPDVIVHTAGLTNVDACEAEPMLAQNLNVQATLHVAKIANAIGAKLIHISTDHLFDGTKPWRTEEDALAPLNAYARTKRDSEIMVQETCPNALIIRTNFIGWGTSVRASFSDWVITSLEQKRDMKMFSDVFFTPILINQMFEILIKLIQKNAIGVFHIAGNQRLSKHEFALRLAEHFGYSTKRIQATSIENSSLKAPRPKDMSLSSNKVEAWLQVQMPTVTEGLENLRDLRLEGWQNALEEAIQGGSTTTI